MTSVQKAFIVAAATAAIGVGSFGVSSVFAAEKAGHPGLDNLVQAIATKFNLNVDEVQKVFDEQRAIGQATRKEDMQKHEAEMLAKAVTDGKLTQAQADLITAKRAELEANKPDLKGKTPEEIRQILKEQGDAVRQWADENGIPENFLHMGGPIMFDHPSGPGMHNGDKFFMERLDDAPANE